MTHPLFRHMFNQYGKSRDAMLQDPIGFATQYEEAIDDYFESGLSLTEYAAKLNFLYSWEVNHWFPSVIDIAMQCYAQIPEKANFLIENISKTTARRGFEGTFYLMTSDRANRPAVLRDRDNAILSVDFFNKVKSKSNLKWMLETIFKNDDHDVLSRLLEIPFYKKALTGIELKRMLSDVNVNPSTQSYSMLMTDTAGSTLDNYLNVLLSMARQNDAAYAQQVYKPEYTRDYGHVLLSYAMRQWHIESSPGMLAMVTKLVEDGADWYLAFKQASVSPSIYLDMLGRQIDPNAELKVMLNEWSNFPSLNRNKNVLKAVVQALPSPVIDQAKADPEIKRVILRMLASDSNTQEPNSP